MGGKYRKKIKKPESSLSPAAHRDDAVPGGTAGLWPPTFSSQIVQRQEAVPSSSQGDSIRDRMFSDEKGNPVFDAKTMRKRLQYSTFQGAGNPELREAMMILYQKPSGDPLKKALDVVARIRGLPREGLEAQYERAMQAREQGRENAKKKGLEEDVSPDLDIGKHPDFTASLAQLRFGKILGDVFGLDAVFGALISPTGGAVGPENKSISDADPENPTVLHGTVHDAAGYLKNAHDKGPGYNYLGASGELDTSNPLAGQSSGTAYWAGKGRVSAGAGVITNALPNLYKGVTGGFLQGGVNMGYFASDDTTVAWLDANTLEEVSKLPAKVKFQALWRLYDGYISEGDLKGMVKIIQASKLSGDTWAVDQFFTEQRMRSMTSLGQRYTIYAELTNAGLKVNRPEEKKAGPAKFDDDDSTVEWLSTRSIGEVSQLSAYDKLKALRALYDGYISDADFEGMVKIIKATKESGDAWVADKFFTAERLRGMTSLGQRFEIRAVLTTVGLSVR